MRNRIPTNEEVIEDRRQYILRREAREARIAKAVATGLPCYPMAVFYCEQCGVGPCTGWKR